jgi:hypothetical protein
MVYAVAGLLNIDDKVAENPPFWKRGFSQMYLNNGWKIRFPYVGNNCSCAVDSEADWACALCSGPLYWKLAHPERPKSGVPCWLLTLRQMGTYGVQIKGVLPWLFRLARPAGERDFYPPLTALVSREQNIFTSPYTISRYVSLSPSNLGRQSCRDHQSLNMFLWAHLPFQSTSIQW